jgi:phosphatidylinositol 4-kinase type 2
MVSMDQKKSKSSHPSPDLRLFVRDVRDPQSKKRPITVRPWATVKDVKDTIQQLIHVQSSAQRLYFGPLLTSGKELPNHRSLFDAGIDRSGETLLLDIKDGSTSSDGSPSILSLRYANDVCISSSMYDATPKALRALVQQARRGLAIGLKPDLALEGSGGTYFLHDSRKQKIAVFKPGDEEPYADNNPRGYLRQQPGDSLRKGIVPGEACIREVAAYLLDHDGFSGVPMTTLVEARHPAFNTNGFRLNVSQGGASIGSHSITPSNSGVSLTKHGNEDNRCMTKPGSFQEFIHCECTIDDISPSKISVEEIHKIAILDIRLMNADRNAANLAVCRNSDNSLRLVPIDHGYCLRSVCDVSWMDWCWLDWPQLKQVCNKVRTGLPYIGSVLGS